jgi:hypothetical protein
MEVTDSDDETHAQQTNVLQFIKRPSATGDGDAGNEWVAELSSTSKRLKTGLPSFDVGYCRLSLVNI